MPVCLALAYMICHGLALGLFPAHGMAASSLFLVASPLLAGVACLRHTQQGRAALHWRITALALLLWATGMVFSVIDALAAGHPTPTPQVSLLLYVLYSVPLLFVLARVKRERGAISLIDAVLAVALGLLFSAHALFLARSADTDPAAMAGLQWIFDVQNVCVLLFALVRWWAADEPARRGFFRALSLYAAVYLVCAGYINHCTANNNFGTWSDMLLDLPFLLLAVLALRRKLPRFAQHPHLVRVVQAGGPLILPLLLLVVSTVVVDQARSWAVLGFVVATFGFGLRSILLQVELLERQAALDQLARQDGLTGVANRRQFDAVLQAEWNRARRSGGELALLLVDIDHFKAFNDRFGHPAADRCLQVVAQTLQALAGRSSDYVARYGGEEFAVVVPATPLQGVRVLAERLRAAVAALDLDDRAMVTISVGAAFQHPPVSASPEQLLIEADEALYEAKRSGRNRVVLRDARVAIAAA